MKAEWMMRSELRAATNMLEDKDKELDGNKIAFLAGVASTLKWILYIDETKPPTEGF